MPFRAREAIYLDAANKPCAEDDPAAATMLATAGATLADKVVERLGLTKHKSLERVGGPGVATPVEAAPEAKETPPPAAKGK